MCGIAGILSPTPSDLAAIHPMTAALAHRGPDDQGIWSQPGIALGHRRLSIIDLSSAGHQPMLSADGRYVLVYNGELYNFRELRTELADYPFRSRTDSEVVLAALAHWGLEALQRFNGMYAFALYDIPDNPTAAQGRANGFHPKPPAPHGRRVHIHHRSTARCVPGNATTDRRARW